MVLDDAVVRLFLMRPPRRTAEDLLRDVISERDPGAVAMIEFGLSLRCNRRSRRSLSDFTAAAGASRRPRWFSVFLAQAFNLYRLFLVHGPSNCPNSPSFQLAREQGSERDRAKGCL
jgi:hypothetical protein